MDIIKIGALWCPACIITNNNLDKIINNYDNINVIEYDYDYDEEIVNKYNVGSILPVLIIMKNNVEIKRIIGEKTYKELEKEIGEVYEEV